MIAKPVTLLAGALALLLAVECLMGSGGAPSPAPVPGQPAASQATPPAGAVNANWSGIVLARPLFRPDRRPPAAIVAAVVDTTLPRLSAIVITKGGRNAVFDGAGTPEVVSVGGRIGAYQVRNITPDSVALRGPNGDVTVHPQYADVGGAPGTVADSGSSNAVPDAPPVPDNIQPPPPPGRFPDGPL